MKWPLEQGQVGRAFDSAERMPFGAAASATRGHDQHREVRPSGLLAEQCGKPSSSVVVDCVLVGPAPTFVYGDGFAELALKLEHVKQYDRIGDVAHVECGMLTDRGPAQCDPGRIGDRQPSYAEMLQMNGPSSKGPRSGCARGLYEIAARAGSPYESLRSCSRRSRASKPYCRLTHTTETILWYTQAT